MRDARAEAEKIMEQAHHKAEDTEKNAMTEIALAGRQAKAKIKSEIENMIVARSTEAGVKAATLDAAFIKDMLLAVAKNWNNGSKVELEALLPEAQRKTLDKAIEASAKALLAEGVEGGYSAEVKSGGYYISFSDESFEALLSSYLREKVSDLLFKA